MNIFKGIRLGIWCIILTACLSVALLYVAVSQAFLSLASLKTIVETSNLSETVRSEILLPKILQTTRSSNYAALLDDKTVTDAFNKAVSQDTLNKKLEPAIESLEQWLNSKEPTVDFTVDMSDISHSFADSLAAEVAKKYDNLPACTYKNTSRDFETGVCSSWLLSKEKLTEKIKELVKNDSSLQENTTLTPDSVSLLSSIQRVGNDLPTYLNIFYALAIVSAGLAALISLWLLLKHRLLGVITLGISGLLTGVVLFVAAVLGTQQIGSVSDNQHILQIARAASSTIELVLQKQAMYAAGSGFLFVTLGVVAKLLLARRRNTQPPLRLSESHNTPEDSKNTIK